ncbi:MAG TPA: hypothetical protein PLP17_17095, partial [Oligoflexia bacterium]|nr:hypothetical protein [Oligoflexia bacterium]
MNPKRKNGVRLNTRRLGVERLEDRRLLAIFMEGVLESGQPEAFAADPMFDPVGFFYLNMADGWHRGGSAVLIAPDWLLTAGHNLFGSDGAGGGISELRFYTGGRLLEGYDHQVIAEQWLIYPGFSPDSGLGHGVDLGLIHLSEPIVDIAPAVLFSGEDQRDTLMYMAGYGQPGTYSTGLQPFDGRQRAGS